MKDAEQRFMQKMRNREKWQLQLEGDVDYAPGDEGEEPVARYSVTE